MEDEDSDQMTDEIKDNIKRIIKESFKQNEHITSYVKGKLKELYSQDYWSILYIYQGDKKGYRYNISGTFFICKYKGYRILIYSKKKNQKESKDSKKGNIGKLEDDIKSLSKENFDKENKLNEQQNIIDNYKYLIDDLKIKLEENEKKWLSSQKLINEKDEIIKNLNNEMQQLQEKNKFNQTFYTRDQMFAANFLSTDQKVHYTFTCVKKDLFVDIEKKLYEKYPEYKEKNYNFVSQGKIVLRFKTIEENKLVSGVPIVLQN